ncbi:patatin-like phospholipase family protein [Egicoccus sp. AB-alg2]|uniref:patatin-like phospholipase family protein n=1 Tax=Egicoccus sp. AB-alg2 TaxID=3242693 RepID=UPI00359E2FB1
MDDVAVEPNPTVVFVLGGGGVHGAVQVGMLQALQEHDIRPDLILGTSVGAMNGAMLAARPDDTVQRLRALWTNLADYSPFEASLLERASTLTRSRTHLHGNHRLRRLLLSYLPARTFGELVVPFQCVAASIERAGARWFADGPLIDALLASTAVPGLLPPVALGGEHYLDGGLVDSIPVGRALELGATCIYVLQVGRVEQPLRVPTKPWEVGLIAFEIARRHRFVEAMGRVPEGVEVHVLPTGLSDAMDFTDPAQFRYRDTTKAAERMETAHLASSAYLTERQRPARRAGRDGGAARAEEG